MAIMVTTADAVAGNRPSKKFRADASEVMGTLQTRVAEVLAGLGTFSRPTEVQKALDLDQTLGRQVFRLAGASDALRSSGVIPSRTSMRRFLEAAQQRGIPGESVAGVWSAYEVFEKLVETHAGDRTTFNLMVSGASGSEEEWQAADAQHRRNAYRAMSHAMGLQAKTFLQLFIVNEDDAGSEFELAMISGLYGLRVLHPLPKVRVFGQSMSAAADTSRAYREPLGLSDAAEGHLMRAFCSQPLPGLRVADRPSEFGPLLEIFMDQPEVGKIGASNLLFGSVYRRLPALNQSLNISSTSNKPVETMLFDILKKRGKGTAEPTGKASLSLGTTSEKFGAEIMPLRGKFKPELLGRGPSSLSTLEIPHYKEMLNAVASRLDWDIDDFEAWRVRVEFPITQSTVTMSWSDPETGR